MNTKRFISLTVGAAALAALAASCSGNKSEQKAAEAQLETDLNKPAEVVFFAGTGATEETFNFRVGDSLRKKFPQYTITQLKQVGAKGLEEAVTTGAHFDILFHSIGNFESMVIPYKLQYDHSELMQKHKVDLSGLDQTSVAAVKQASGGKFYGLPVYNEFFALFYNKTLFDKFGVAYPKDNMTW
ncbi:MAG: extracellular solute-binding protein family 1, partial [Paenibacillus sp.]|nr:extracellular solute-binding protein family 1 [Paenibacillus sp.]